MTQVLDAETVLTTLYCVVDDTLKGCPQARPTQPGPHWRLTDSELLTLGTYAQFLPQLSERRFLEYIRHRFPGAFPHLPDQPGDNRHLHNLWGVWAWFGPALARQASASPYAPELLARVLYHVVDGLGISLMSKRRGARGRTYGDGAAIGRGGVDRQFFYGAKLAALVGDQGLIYGFVSGPANTEERFLLEGLLRFRQQPSAEAPTADDLAGVLGQAHRHKGARKGPSGPLGPCFGAGVPMQNEVILGDAGYAGQRWLAHWERAYDVKVIVKGQAEPWGLTKWFSSKRQVVESAFSRLHRYFQVDRPRTKSVLGWWIRLSAKVAAHNVLIVLNAMFGRPLGAKLDVVALP